MKLNRAFAWAMFQRGGQMAVAYLFFLLLARLLGPREFGMLSLALVWLGIFRVVGDAGLSSALIQKQDVSSRQLSSAFFLNVGLSIVLALVSVLSSWLFATHVEEPELPLVVSALSLTLVVSGLSVTQQSIAYRDMRFRFLAIRDFTAVIAGGIVGVVAALMGFGVWALVLQSLTVSWVTAALLWRSSQWSPRIEDFSLAELRPLLEFSTWILLFQVFSYAVREVNKLLVGTLAGVAMLGEYTLAAKVIFQPAVQFSGAMGDYLFPKMSGLQKERGSLKSVYVGSISLVMLKVMPVVMVLALLFHHYATAVLGEQWAGARGLAPFVAIAAIGQAFISPAGSAMKAMNRPSWLLWWAVFFSLLIVSGGLIGIRFGLIGCAAGIAAAYMAGAVAISLLMRRLLDVEIDYLGILIAAGIAGGALAYAANAAVSALPASQNAWGPLIVIGSGLLYWKGISRIAKIDISHFYTRT